ncbi:MAG: ankyrin repeat domain-containing protein [Thermoanaerobaculia bacterium]
MNRYLRWGVALFVATVVAMPMFADAESAKRKLAELQLQYDEGTFLWVVKEGRADLVQIFLEAGMTPNLADANSGFTVLMLAANMGRAEVADALAAAGANVNARDNNGNTALLTASVMGHATTVQALMKYRPDANVVEPEAQSTPLHLVIRAAQPGYAEAVRALISGGANVNAKDNKGMTPLLLASSRCEHSAVVAILVQSQADVNARDAYGSTPLAMASALGCTQSAEIISAAGGKK